MIYSPNQYNNPSEFGAALNDEREGTEAGIGPLWGSATVPESSVFMDTDGRTEAKETSFGMTVGTRIRILGAT